MSKEMMMEYFKKKGEQLIELHDKKKKEVEEYSRDMNYTAVLYTTVELHEVRAQLRLLFDLEQGIECGDFS